MAEKEGKTPKGFSLVKLALFLLIVILISGVALYSFLGINPADLVAEGAAGLYQQVFAAGATELNETIKTVAEFDVNEKLAFAAVADDFIIASISSVKRIDSEGREKGYIPVNLKKPFVQTYNEDILIADLQGRYFSLANGSHILWEKTIDEDIINASISDSWILLITKSKQSGYKRTIRAYSRDGQEVSLRNISNYYPYAVYNYPEFSNACFVISGIEASGLEANGLFDFLDPSMNEKASIRGANEIYLGGAPLKKENLFLYGEKSLMAVDQSYKTLWEKKLEGATVTGANVINGEFPVAAELNTDVLERERRQETTVRILNTNGTERAKLIIDANVSGISVQGKTAAVKAGPEVYFINMNGEIMDRFTAKSDIDEVYLAKEDLAYIVNAGAVSRVKVKVNHKFLGIF